MRALWYGRFVSEVVDAVVSAQAMRDLSRSVTITAFGSVMDQHGLAQPSYSRMTTVAELIGYAPTPQGYEETRMYRPFSRGGVIGYMLGFAAYDAMQHAIVSSLPRIGMRPLSVISQRRLMIADAAVHIDGARSWRYVMRQSSIAASACGSLPIAAVTQGGHDTAAVATPDVFNGRIEGFTLSTPPTSCQPYLPLPAWVPAP